MTASVRFFHVPATPARRPARPACPRYRPHGPPASPVGEHPERVGKRLIVCASSATSPFADTVIFCDRSPCAMAVVTWEIDRTWLVRLLGHGVHVVGQVAPGAGARRARRPARRASPSVPTSRATRVTSSANEESWSTIVFTVRPMERNSPRSGRPSISRFMCWDRSPWRRPRSPWRSPWSVAQVVDEAR